MKYAVSALTSAIARANGVVSLEWIEAIDLSLKPHDTAWFRRVDTLGAIVCEENAPCIGCGKRFGDRRTPQALAVVQQHWCAAVCANCASKPNAKKTLLSKLKEKLPPHIKIVIQEAPGSPRADVQRGSRISRDKWTAAMTSTSQRALINGLAAMTWKGISGKSVTLWLSS